MRIERIDPPSWFVGMDAPTLQLMLTGEDLDNAGITVCYPGIEVKCTVKADDEHYAFLYLDLAGCDAGTMLLDVKKGADVLSIPYVLKPRAMHGEDRRSVSPADVVYL